MVLASAKRRAPDVSGAPAAVVGATGVSAVVVSGVPGMSVWRQAWGRLWEMSFSTRISARAHEEPE